MPEVALTFAFSIHGSENAIGTDFFKPFTVLVITHPNKHGLSNNVVFRNIPPLSSVQTVVAIVPHHPVIVLLKRVGTCQFSVNKSFAVFIDFQIMTFVFADDSSEMNSNFSCQIHCLTCGRNEYRTKVVPCVVVWTFTVTCIRIRE